MFDNQGSAQSSIQNSRQLTTGSFESVSGHNLVVGVYHRHHLISCPFLQSQGPAELSTWREYPKPFQSSIRTRGLRLWRPYQLTLLVRLLCR